MNKQNNLFLVSVVAVCVLGILGNIQLDEMNSSLDHQIVIQEASVSASQVIINQNGTCIVNLVYIFIQPVTPDKYFYTKC